MLGLRFCARAFPSRGKRGPLFTAVRGPPTLPASPVVEHRLQTRRLSNCGTRAQSLCGMRDPPRPGLEPLSPALAGGLPTTAPPGKPWQAILNHCATREVPVFFFVISFFGVSFKESFFAQGLQFDVRYFYYLFIKHLLFHSINMFNV